MSSIVEVEVAERAIAGCRQWTCTRCGALRRQVLEREEKDVERGGMKREFIEEDPQGERRPHQRARHGPACILLAPARLVMQAKTEKKEE